MFAGQVLLVDNYLLLCYTVRRHIFTVMLLHCLSLLPGWCMKLSVAWNFGEVENHAYIWNGTNSGPGMECVTGFKFITTFIKFEDFLANGKLLFPLFSFRQLLLLNAMPPLD